MYIKAPVKIGLAVLVITFAITSVGFLIPSLSQTTILNAGEFQSGTESFKVTYSLIEKDTTGTGIVYTPQCFECHLPFNFSYSGADAPSSIVLPISKFAYDLRKQNPEDDINLFAIRLLVNHSYMRSIDNITTTCVDKTATNGTSYSECIYTNNPYQVPEWKWVWEPLPSNITMKKGKWYVVDFIFKRKPTLNKYSTDLIPIINSVSLNNLEWFNTSYMYRTNFTVKIPSADIVTISGDTKIVVPIRLDTQTLINNGYMNSDGSDLTVVDQNNAQLNWTWCDYTSETIGINKANTCLAVQHTVKTDNSSIISLYYGNLGDNLFQNASFNDTFSLSTNTNPMILLLGGINGTHIPPKTGWYNLTKTSGNNLANVTGRKVQTASNFSGTAQFSAPIAPFPLSGSPFTFMMWFKTPLGSSNQVPWDGDTTGGDGGTWIQINGGIYCSQSGFTSHTIQANTWYFMVCKGQGSTSSTTVLTLFNDTSFIERKSGTTTQDSSEETPPKLSNSGTPYNGDMELFLLYSGEVSNDAVNATWSAWSNYTDLVVNQSEETGGGNFVNKTAGVSAIEYGIKQALGDDSVIYSNQQIYVRYVNTTQQLARFDKVTKFGNQIWAFNYFNDSTPFVNMQNITSAFYVRELANKTSYDEIRNGTSNFIGQTKVS